MAMTLAGWATESMPGLAEAPLSHLVASLLGQTLLPAGSSAVHDRPVVPVSHRLSPKQPVWRQLWSPATRSLSQSLAAGTELGHSTSRRNQKDSKKSPRC